MSGMQCGYHTINGKMISTAAHHVLIILLKKDGIDFNTIVQEVYKEHARVNTEMGREWYTFKSPSIRKGLVYLICNGLVTSKKTHYWKHYYLDLEAIRTFFNIQRRKPLP